MNYNNVESILNVKDNMQVLRNNTKQDDGVDTVTGVDWFKFNNKVVDKIYVSGNSFYGFGDNTNHLSICNRDGAMYYLYREEGTLYHYYKFLKLRWEGYSYYSSTDVQYKLVHELLLFDTGDMYINIITLPTNASYFGSSSILSSGSQLSLGLTLGTPEYLSLYHNDENGVAWTVKHEKINIIYPFVEKFLLKKDNAYYSLINDVLTMVDITELNAQAFIDHGFDHPSSYDFMKEMVGFELLNWIETDIEIGDLTLVYEAIPNDQILTTKSFDINHPSINGINNITIDSDNASYQFSFDFGTTFEVYKNGWIVANDTWMTKDEVILLDYDVFALKEVQGYIVRIKLNDQGYFKNMIVYYRNEVLV